MLLCTYYSFQIKLDKLLTRKHHVRQHYYNVLQMPIAAEIWHFHLCDGTDEINGKP